MSSLVNIRKVNWSYLHKIGDESVLILYDLVSTGMGIRQICMMLKIIMGIKLRFANISNRKFQIRK